MFFLFVALAFFVLKIALKSSNQFCFQDLVFLLCECVFFFVLEGKKFVCLHQVFSLSLRSIWLLRDGSTRKNVMIQVQHQLNLVWQGFAFLLEGFRIIIVNIFLECSKRLRGTSSLASLIYQQKRFYFSGYVLSKIFSSL